MVFCLAAACGLWVYGCWIDQGRSDPCLREPYAYGWHAAVILKVLTGAGVAGTWCTVAFDQAFPSPSLFAVLYMLKIYAIGTCQQNRRGFPSLQIAADHKAAPGGFKAFKSKVGNVVHKCHVLVVAGVKVPLLAVQWFDKMS